MELVLARIQHMVIRESQVKDAKQDGGGSGGAYQGTSGAGATGTSFSGGSGGGGASTANGGNAVGNGRSRTEQEEEEVQDGGAGNPNGAGGGEIGTGGLLTIYANHFVNNRKNFFKWF